MQTKKQLEYLQRAGATVLVATPSYGLHMAEMLRERGIDRTSLSLEWGSFEGEPRAENPATRAKIEAGLGIEAFDYHGLAEIWPTFASEARPRPSSTSLRTTSSSSASIPSRVAPFRTGT